MFVFAVDIRLISSPAQSSFFSNYFFGGIFATTGGDISRVMWRSQYGAPAIERPVKGLEELSPGSMMGSSTRSTPSPSTASLHSSPSYSSHSPSPSFKTQTNGAGWGHCAPLRFEQAPVLV